MNQKLEIETVREGQHYVVIALRGEATFGQADEMKKVLLGAAQVRGRKGMIIDCQDLTYMDSSALGIIVAVHSVLNRKQGRLVLARVHRDLIAILDVSRLRKLIPNTRTMAEATMEIEDYLGIAPDEKEA